MNKKKIAFFIKQIFKEIGEDTERSGLLDTPNRIAKMYEEIFRGYDETQKPKITVFENNNDGIAYDDIVTDEGCFNSFCEHHMALFSGKYYFGYIAGNKVMGLSKVARVVDYFSAKLQIQERLGRDIIKYIEEIVQPKGCVLMLEASHSCKSVRGVKKEGKMRTIITTGLFREEPILEQKFISLVKN